MTTKEATIKLPIEVDVNNEICNYDLCDSIKAANRVLMYYFGMVIESRASDMGIAEPPFMFPTINRMRLRLMDNKPEEKEVKEIYN